jgi:hypothetical protein
MHDHRPVIITSISPVLSRGQPATHDHGLAYQAQCLRSWIECGAQVISVNNRVEIAMLDEDHREVEFRGSTARRGAENPKGLPLMSELLEIGRQLPPGTPFGIVNSDVEFRGDRDVLASIFEAARSSCVFANRYEHRVHSAEPSLPYLYGYDLFVVNNNYVSPSELADFHIGSPWWDYLFIYLMIVREVPLVLLGSAVISHSTHDQAWSETSWMSGLRLVARRLRQLSQEEGPVAALLGYICRSFEQGAVAGFTIDTILSQFGVVLGTAMVGCVSAACERTLWFDGIDDERGYLPRGRGWWSTCESQLEHTGRN